LRQGECASFPLGWGYAPDGGGAGGSGDGGTGSSSGQQDDPPAAGEKPRIELTPEQLQERLDRARRQGETAAADRQRQETDENLAAQRRFEDLATARQEQITGLQARVTELQKQLDDQTTRMNELTAAMQERINAETKDIPEHLKVLLSRMTPVEQLQYLSKHGQDLATPRNAHVPANPPADTNGAAGEGDALTLYLQRAYGAPPKVG
jgi:hypothetical protein